MNRLTMHTPNWDGLATRIQSAILLAIPALIAVAIGGFVFNAMILLAAVQMFSEWQKLTETRARGWHFIGLAYVVIPCASLIWLRSIPAVGEASGGGMLILFLLLAVWGTDIGAYFSGRYFGGPKIAPKISPNKTWAGLIGGSMLAITFSLIMSPFVLFPTTFFAACGTGLLIAIISQAGDFFESWLKRQADVKDSGALIPGHGGLLDRIDGLVFAAPVYALLCAIWL